MHFCGICGSTFIDIGADVFVVSIDGESFITLVTITCISKRNISSRWAFNISTFGICTTSVGWSSVFISTLVDVDTVVEARCVTSFTWCLFIHVSWCTFTCESSIIGRKFFNIITDTIETTVVSVLFTFIKINAVRTSSDIG